MKAGGWPAVGREAELANATDALRAQSGVFICGEAGVGKTHLADRAIREFTSLCGEVVSVPILATSVLQMIPLAALEPLLGTDPRRGAVPVAEALGLLMSSRAQDAVSIVVHVSDGDLLDEATAAVLASLCRSGDIRLVVTARSLSSASDALVRLWTDDTVSRVNLEPFDLAATGELLSAVLSGPVAAETVLAVWRRTGGNARFVTELTRSALASGDLFWSEGAWLWTEPAVVAPSVTDLVARELGALVEAERHAAEMVALAEPVPTEDLYRVAEPAAVDALNTAGWLVPESYELGHPGRASFRFRHPIMSETIRSWVSPERRRELFSHLFLHGTRPVSGPDISLPRLLRSVAWALECGIRLPDADLLEAADAAVRLNEHRFAEGIATAALTHLGDSGLPRVKALTLRAVARRFLGEPVAARTDLREAESLLAKLGPSEDPEWMRCSAAVADTVAELAQFHADDPDLAAAIVSPLLDDLQSVAGPVAASLYRSMRINALARQGWAGRFEEIFRPASEILADPHLPVEQKLPLLAPAALGMAQRGELLSGLDLLENHVEGALVHTWHVPWALAEILSARFMIGMWLGETERLARNRVLPAPGREYSNSLDPASGQLGDALLAAAGQQWSKAAADLAAASSRLTRNDPSGLLAVALLYEARAAAALGETAKAAGLLRRARQTPLRAARAIRSDLWATEIAVAMALGEPRALAQAVEMADWCAQRGLVLGELWASHLAVVGSHEGPNSREMLSRAQAAASAVDADIAALFAEHAEALVGGQQELAANVGRQLAGRGVWVPPVRVSRLTPRQREVAYQAARGMSSREIAVVLGVSVRTVDSHLAQVYVQLGISRRQDLATFLY